MDVDNVRIVQQKLEDHSISIIRKGTNSQDYFQGEKMKPIVWPVGSVAFVPAGGEVSGTFSEPTASTIVRLEHRYFLDAARDHIDFAGISLRFGQIQGPAAKWISMALSHIASNDEFAHWPLLAETVSLAVAVALIQEMSPEANILFNRMPGGLNMPRKRRVVDFVESNLHRPITLEEMAAAASLSPFHFSRSFKQSTGMTPLKYVANRRIEAAKKLMRSTTLSLAMVAFSTGFVSQQHFSTAFRVVTGQSPGQYQSAMADVGDRRRARLMAATEPPPA